MTLRTPRLRVSRRFPHRLVNEQRTLRPFLLDDELRVSMAFQAVLCGNSGVVEHATDLVRLVTIHAGRDLVGLFLPEPPRNEPLVHLLDTTVALHARLGHVVGMDTGSLVRVGG